MGKYFIWQGGITPAHAGNTVFASSTLLVGRDHPRTCGEYTPSFYAAKQPMGSPPHMRGIPINLSAQKGKFGITPAHAGNTCQLCIKSTFIRDHPRTCGEYSVTKALGPIRSGSPPHMRGIPLIVLYSYFCLGITPAHAGNTRVFPNDIFIMRDHPRTCGEYSLLGSLVCFHLGSPPHMRGILL